jgi:hypothetical protein
MQFLPLCKKNPSIPEKVKDGNESDMCAGCGYNSLGAFFVSGMLSVTKRHGRAGSLTKRDMKSPAFLAIPLKCKPLGPAKAMGVCGNFFPIHSRKKTYE